MKSSLLRRIGSLPGTTDSGNCGTSTVGYGLAWLIDKLCGVGEVGQVIAMHASSVPPCTEIVLAYGNRSGRY
ncbi:MAG: hypothetical protein ACREBC_11800 [Pyrinomonadaceae bacterium]